MKLPRLTIEEKKRKYALLQKIEELKDLVDKEEADPEGKFDINHINVIEEGIDEMLRLWKY